jgi:hypothetical protein
MALDDLDLEFEDEEEVKKKKGDALHQDVDLEFQLQENEKPRPVRPGAPPQPPHGMGQVKKIDEARAAQPLKRPPLSGQSAPRPGEASAPRAVGANALKAEGDYDLESEEIVQLRERARKAEFDAEVKVQVAEFKVEILSEMLGDMKLMDHQINQLLVRINAKHPDMKQEVLMIKKILADFTAKKRK